MDTVSQDVVGLPGFVFLQQVKCCADPCKYNQSPQNRNIVRAKMSKFLVEEALTGL